MIENIVKKLNAFPFNKHIDIAKIKEYLIINKLDLKTLNKAFVDYLLITSILSNTFSIFGNNSEINNFEYNKPVDDEISSDISLEQLLAQKGVDFILLAVDAVNSAIDEYISEQNKELYTEHLYNFLIKEGLTLEQFSYLLHLMVANPTELNFHYESAEEAFLDICFRDYRTTEEKMLIIMVRDGISYSELDECCAVCIKEATGAGECYEDCFGVASILLNRVHDVRYVDSFGNSIYDQLTAPGQFEVYLKGLEEYEMYLGRLDLIGYQAVVEAIYSEEASHDYLEFRGNWVDVVNYETLVDGGNKYLVTQTEDRYLPDQKITINEDEVKELVLQLFF